MVSIYCLACSRSISSPPGNHGGSFSTRCIINFGIVRRETYSIHSRIGECGSLDTTTVFEWANQSTPSRNGPNPRIPVSPVANLVQSGATSTEHTELVPSTSATFSLSSVSHTLAPFMVPQTTHFWSLDTEIANKSIPVCFPSSRPSASRHRRISLRVPSKKLSVRVENECSYGGRAEAFQEPFSCYGLTELSMSRITPENYHAPGFVDDILPNARVRSFRLGSVKERCDSCQW